MPSSVQILSTRTINKSLLEQAAAYDIYIDSIPFINIEPLAQEEVGELVASIPTGTEVNVVFTSSNAVEAMKDMETDASRWNVYCMAGATGEAVRRILPAAVIRAEEESAAELAKQIIKEGDIKQVFFFCGDKRRDDLPGLLRDAAIEVSEIIVYKTVLTPTSVEKEYNGLLFFSPSAVESYLQQNEINERTVIFAIGKTTAGALKEATKSIIVAEHPNTEDLISKVIKHFRPEAAVK
jgi:uroporphyrinogen-III synthase